jgi:predicted dehydrogenase
MQDQSNNQSSAVSRRQFLKSSSLAAASVAAVTSFPSILHGQEKKAINAVIIGLGGRGGGAGVNFMEAVKATGVDGKIVAVADLFPEQANRGQDNFGVPADKCFSGFDAYKKALEVPGVNYAILATPPGFRSAHFKACVEAGKNVFMEKPVAVDGPTARMMYAAAEAAKQKNLKVAAGTQRRHQTGYIETIKRLHDGAIGDIATLRVYWVNGGPIWCHKDHGDSDLERQIRNWYHYIWLSGDHICEQHVHNLDVGNWIMKGHPVRCWGMGARQQLDLPSPDFPSGKPGEIWDNFAVEYEYANGTRMYAYCGQIDRDWSSVSEGVQGTSGTSNPGGSISAKGGWTWRHRGDGDRDAYVQEHIDLINAIVKDTELNEAKQVTDSTLTAIMGREAGYSGAGVEWDAILNSEFAYGPEALFKDCSQMQYGPFRTLKPPMPKAHNILKDPPLAPVKV